MKLPLIHRGARCKPRGFSAIISKFPVQLLILLILYPELVQFGSKTTRTKPGTEPDLLLLPLVLGGGNISPKSASASWLKNAEQNPGKAPAPSSQSPRPSRVSQSTTRLCPGVLCRGFYGSISLDVLPYPVTRGLSSTLRGWWHIAESHLCSYRRDSEAMTVLLPFTLPNLAPFQLHTGDTAVALSHKCSQSLGSTTEAFVPIFTQRFFMLHLPRTLVYWEHSALGKGKPHWAAKRNVIKVLAMQH